VAADSGAEEGRGVMYRTPRCIAISGTRCRRPAALKRNGDLFICTKHTFWTMVLIDDMLAPATRRMLAFARWETVAEGQAWIRAYRKVAA